MSTENIPLAKRHRSDIEASASESGDDEDMADEEDDCEEDEEGDYDEDREVVYGKEGRDNGTDQKDTGMDEVCYQQEEDTEIDSDVIAPTNAQLKQQPKTSGKIAFNLTI